MIVLIWIQTGFAMVILSAALRGIPEETIEAAIVDGANPFQIFFKIKVPQIMPTIVVVWTTITLTVLKVFDIVFAMTNGNGRRRFWPITCTTSCSARRRLGRRVGRGDGHHAAGHADPGLERLQGPQGDALRAGGDMDNIAGKKSSLTWAVHISVAALVLLWLFPTVGFWCRPSARRPDRGLGLVGGAVPVEQNLTLARADPETQLRGGRRVRDRGQHLRGRWAFTETAVISLRHLRARSTPLPPGETAELRGARPSRCRPTAITLHHRRAPSLRSGAAADLFTTARRRPISRSTTTTPCCSRPAARGDGARPSSTR
jgi:hypothetical protein